MARMPCRDGGGEAVEEYRREGLRIQRLRKVGGNWEGGRCWDVGEGVEEFQDMGTKSRREEH